MEQATERDSIRHFSAGGGFGDLRPRGVAPVTFLDDPPPSERRFAIVSVDDHLLEPADIFERRLPSKLRERAPRLVRQEDGSDAWHIDDVAHPVTMGNAVAGRPLAEWRSGGISYDEVRPGVIDPIERVADMDRAGVWASLCFPSMPWGFAGQTFTRMRDREVGRACLAAYNDWLVEDWAGSAPERFIVSALPWLGDVDGAVEELRRNAERGVRAVSFTENPDPLGLPSLHSGVWDPFFAACEETGTVLNLHVGSASWTPIPSSDSPVESVGTLFSATTMIAAVEWLWSQVFLRFPRLVVALSEGGIGWVPVLLDRLRNMERYLPAYHNWPATAPLPHEVVLRNFRFCSLFDPLAWPMLDAIGADNVMVEVDYPHMDSIWPDAQALLAEHIGHLDADVIRKVTYRNACDLYGHPEPPAGFVTA
jgi:predicted TIM-barrel fold metal-dependent hydrolase